MPLPSLKSLKSSSTLKLRKSNGGKMKIKKILKKRLSTILLNPWFIAWIFLFFISFKLGLIIALIVGALILINVIIEKNTEKHEKDKLIKIQNLLNVAEKNQEIHIIYFEKPYIYRNGEGIIFFGTDPEDEIFSFHSRYFLDALKLMAKSNAHITESFENTCSHNGLTTKDLRE